MPRLCFSSLKVRLLLLTLLAILPGLALTLSTTAQQGELARVRAQENTLRLAQQAVSAQRDLIQEARTLLMRRAQLPALAHDDPATCNAHLSNLLKQHPQFTEFGVAEPTGNLRCSTLLVSQPLNLIDQTWLQRTVQTRNFMIGNYQIDPLTQKAVVAFGYPVLNAAGQVQAVVFAKLELNWPKRIATEAQLPPDSVIQVIDQTGMILIRHPHPHAWVGQSLSKTAFFRMLTRQDQGVAEVPDPDGITRLVAFSRLGGSSQGAEVYVTVGIPQKFIWSEVKRLSTRNLSFLGLVTSMALAAAWFGGELLIRRPLKVLVKATKQLAAGDLSTRTGMSHGHGELRQLAVAFDQMAASLEQRERQLEHQAFYDALTQLPNRTLFMDRLASALKRTQRRGGYLFAVFFLDVDHFKLVNDSLGHLIGDQLLIAIARRLETCLRPEDTIARLGGDEFTILLEDTQDINNVLRVAERIQAQLQQPFNLDTQEVVTSASIGIALSAIRYEHPEELLRDADIALYQAKTLGRACYKVFDTAMHARVLARWQLERQLRRALEHQEFLLYYQPTVFLATSQIRGFEALVYWNHPGRGLVSPVEFIAVAEETGLILPLGQWVLRQACHQMSKWQVQFPTTPPLTISVNLSGKQVSQPDLLPQIQKILQETQLQASTLKLEITESVITENAESDRQKLLELKELGAQLYIDDFGTGYSSLSRLQSFPIDALKIDRTFVSGMEAHTGNTEIVQAIVTLAHSLKLDVVAEGVELAEQAAQLQQLGCEYGQGYFFSKPVDAESAAALLVTRNQSHLSLEGEFN